MEYFATTHANSSYYILTAIGKNHFEFPEVKNTDRSNVGFLSCENDNVLCFLLFHDFKLLWLHSVHIMYITFHSLKKHVNTIWNSNFINQIRGQMFWNADIRHLELLIRK